MEKLHPLEFNYQEMRLLRALVTEIEAVDKQFPGVVPHDIMKRYNAIKDLYATQMANEEYENSTIVPRPEIDEAY